MGLLKATYGGVEIPVKITRLDRNLMPSITTNTRSVENINGGEFTHSTYSQKQIAMEFQIPNSTAKGLAEFRRKMPEILYSKEPKRLIFSDEPSIYYEAIVDGEPVLGEDDMYSTGTITWLIPDGVPIGYDGVGAVTMKMISNTSSTSASGMMFISTSGPSPPELKAIVYSPQRFSRSAMNPTLAMPIRCAVSITLRMVPYLVVASPRTLTAGCGVFCASTDRTLSS